MFNSWKGIKKPFEVIVLLSLSLFIFTSALFGEEADRKPEAKSEGNAGFVLKINDGLISLDASDASLKEIVEEIGRRMNIEVDVHILEAEKITMEFEKLSLEDAIKRLSTNYVYFMDSKKEEGRITKIVLLPRGEGTAISIPVTKEPEVIEGQKVVRLESALREKSTQPKSEEADKEKSPRPEPFKFEFEP